MNLLRVLVIAVLGLTAAPSLAVPVRFTLEADDFTVWDYAFRDGNGTVILGVVTDSDGDGLETFIAKRKGVRVRRRKPEEGCE